MNHEPFGDPLTLIVSREEIESQDIQLALSVLSRFTESPQIARANMGKVNIAFDGYDQDRRELFEIPEVRTYVYKLDEKFPFWLYFMSMYYTGLQCIMLCFLPPYLTDEAKARIHPKQLSDLLTRRWFPAMNYVSGYAGLTENEIEELTNRVLLYITNGRLLKENTSSNSVMLTPSEIERLKVKRKAGKEYVEKHLKV